MNGSTLSRNRLKKKKSPSIRIWISLEKRERKRERRTGDAFFYLGFFVFSSSKNEKGWVEFSTPLSPEWLVTEFDEEKGGITIKGEEDITLLPGDEILDAPHRTRLKVEADGLAVIIKGNDILYKGYRYY